MLHAFAGSDGANPIAGVIRDRSGNLYGTTTSGGDFSCYNGTGCGTVFKLARDGELATLHAFRGRKDGADPVAGLLIDHSGNLYGTAAGGGNMAETCAQWNGCGTVFEITASGKMKVLYTFCTQPRCTDGSIPLAALTEDGSGNLYGTANRGGAYGGGVVYKIRPDGTETTLYSFCSGTCHDGGLPQAGVVLDEEGNLYGATLIGGLYDQGVVFKLASDGSETVLQNFTMHTDGAQPYGTLLRKSDGRLYGTLAFSGATCPNMPGVVFRLDPDGNEKDYCIPAVPFGSVIEKGKVVYGTASEGPFYPTGVLFEIIK